MRALRKAMKGADELTQSPSALIKIPTTPCTICRPGAVAQSEALQKWLNTFPGIFVKVHGIPGEKTSNAYRKVTGHYLQGMGEGRNQLHEFRL